MRLLDRYLARQVLLGTVTAVVILTLVFGLGNIFKRALPQLVDNTLSLERFGQFIIYILPFAIAYTVPWGFLSAVLLTFGRLSADNELVAMRMSGRSMWRLCAPVFALAVALSGLCFWLNLTVSPQSKWEMKRIVKDVLSDDPSIIFREKGVLDDTVIHVEPGADKWSGTNVRLVKVDEWNRPIVWAFAEDVVLRKDDKQLTAELLDVATETREPHEFTVQTLPLAELDTLPLSGRSLFVLALVGNQIHLRAFNAQRNMVVDKPEAELVPGEDLEELRASLLERRSNGNPSLSSDEQESLIRKALTVAGRPGATLTEGHALMQDFPFDPNESVPMSFANFPLEMTIPSNRPKPNEMTRREILTALEDTELDPEDRAEYRTEMTKRYSISLACLAFCFIGIPLGVTAQRRETSIGFALSLVVAVLYFLFIFLGETFGEEDTWLPHALMWSPSVLFIGLGSFLFYRLNRR